MIAYCHRCHEPLVGTLAFRRYEFYCLNCGAKYGYLEPLAVDETPERLERMHAVEKEWATLADGLLSEGGLRTGCQQCSVGFAASHMDHATEEEKEAHAGALARVNVRAAAWVPPVGHGWQGAVRPT